MEVDKLLFFSDILKYLTDELFCFCNKDVTCFLFERGYVKD